MKKLKVELEDLIKYSKTVRVLYAESDEKLRKDSLGIFKIFFHKIDAAKDGVEGFNYFENNKYDLIITSIDMPNMNGVEMITKIREISKDITILIKSSNTNNFIDLIRLGIDGYILKPVEIKQFTSIIQKVIEKLQNKQELYEYKNYLEQKVKDKTKALESLNNNLEQKVKEEISKNKYKDNLLSQQSKMAAMGEMIGNIAHQWRQPLTAISAASSGMQVQKECGVLTDEEFIKNCDVINKNVNHLSKTIDDFRDFIKGDRKQKIFNLKENIDTFLSLVESLCKSYNIDVVLNLQEDIQIDGFYNELTQCFMNIFNNAKDALKETKNKERLLFISTRIEDQNVIIKIKDNAGGIPENIISRIFEPYFTTKHKSQGTGLGLHMTYSFIVDGMNGTIKVNNVEFQYKNKKYTGAEFKIILPM
ncbi:MAG: hybrid sensor histidine kinase/response regulator [Arcobacteraceae bacterium]|nr:hybrid sensor histidine kinase/response regulator [Arcobacteraceae bacterium]